MARRLFTLPKFVGGLDDDFEFNAESDTVLAALGYGFARGELKLPRTPSVTTEISASLRKRIGDAEVTPVAVPHGLVTVFAYRIGDLAYVTDAKSIPPEAAAILRGAKVLVINALFRTDHPSHLSLPEAISAAREIGAARTYLTHLTHDNFHADLEAELPRDIQPAFDGLTVRI